jgi:glyoxylase-like metal-dependent hydrolase (beta-lactamase superfamily II)
VLVDCGMHGPQSMEHLEGALAQVGLAIEQVHRLLVTHAHADHWGQAAAVMERSGAQLWMHPDHTHGTAGAGDPEAALARRIEIGRQSGVPEGALRAYAQRLREMPSGLGDLVEPDHPLLAGVEVESDLGTWEVVETPGHAPSHVCLHQPDRRILISGDHLLGRISLYFDYGWSPDPVGEFLTSLDRVERLQARLCLSGHGRPFTDVRAHIEGNRRLVAQRLEAAADAVRGAPHTALQLIPAVYGEPLSEETASWRLTETLCYLRHLELSGRLARDSDGVAEWWRGGRAERKP